MYKKSFITKYFKIQSKLDFQMKKYSEINHTNHIHTNNDHIEYNYFILRNYILMNFY